MQINNDTSVGVIVGRFHTSDLHEGHLDVIKQVVEKHPRVIIFLGQSYHICTKRNPLPFYIRRQMIEEAFPEFVTPLEDFSYALAIKV